MDTEELSEKIESLSKEAKSFFNSAYIDVDEEFEPPWMKRNEAPNAYWEMLQQETRNLSQKTQESLLNFVAMIFPTLKSSPVLDESDEKDIGRCVKRMRASLRLRNYRSWDIEVIHDEGEFRGISPPGQSEDDNSPPSNAKKAFFDCLERLEGIIQLLKISPTYLPNGLPQKNPNLSQSYRPNTAFIMMPINTNDPENEDIYAAYKECFTSFGITAVRADDIEHEDVITKRIIKEIKSSEFLVGDLTDERPSVYYEIGYAHSLGRRVILYRKSETSIHFDLAAYNCPEYKNITELKSLVMKRLEEATNRKPQSG